MRVDGLKPGPAGKITVFFLNASNYLSDLPQPVIKATVADKKFEIE
jgi:hypothetical protein